MPQSIDLEEEKALLCSIQQDIEGDALDGLSELRVLNIDWALAWEEHVTKNLEVHHHGCDCDWCWCCDSNWLHSRPAPSRTARCSTLAGSSTPHSGTALTLFAYRQSTSSSSSCGMMTWITDVIVMDAVVMQVRRRPTHRSRCVPVARRGTPGNITHLHLRHEGGKGGGFIQSKKKHHICGIEGVAIGSFSKKKKK